MNTSASSASTSTTSSTRYGPRRPLIVTLALLVSPERHLHWRGFTWRNTHGVGAAQVAGVRVYGPKPGPNGEGRAALTAFSHVSIQHSDLSTFMDLEGVAIRSGHHCTQPLHRHLGITGTCRASSYCEKHLWSDALLLLEGDGKLVAMCLFLVHPW